MITPVIADFIHPLSVSLGFNVVLVSLIVGRVILDSVTGEFTFANPKQTDHCKRDLLVCVF